LTFAICDAAIGFAIGGSIGLILGLITGTSRTGERLLDTSVQMLRNVPHLALILTAGREMPEGDDNILRRGQDARRQPASL
jgi:ABC-type amino acid transport system permease subunit